MTVADLRATLAHFPGGDMRKALLVLPLLAACTAYESGPCDDLCTELYRECGYAAFPTFSSCYQGCTYAEVEEGADVAGEAACVEAAECDTFQILECEHAHRGVN